MPTSLTPCSTVVYFSPATSTAIVRVGREHFRMLCAALCLMDRLPKPHNTPCVFQVVRVSGTIKKAEEEAIRRARAAARRARIEGSEAMDELGGLKGLIGLDDEEQDEDEEEGESEDKSEDENESMEDG